MEKIRCGNESLRRGNKKQEKIILKRRGKEFQIGEVGVVLIVMQTVIGFRKPTKLIIILRITEVKPTL